ncbi:hypothetical protein BGZ81_001655 [Podila clonocystis]|nr:hypothetical protein BGZ81_001655 [Podila clonocystis]
MTCARPYGTLPPINMCQKRSPQMLFLHADHIRKRVCPLHTHDPEYIEILYTRLTQLIFRSSGNFIGSGTWDVLAKLVKRNIQLQELTVQNMNSTMLMGLWQTLASLPALHSVTPGLVTGSSTL